MTSEFTIHSLHVGGGWQQPPFIGQKGATSHDETKRENLRGVTDADPETGCMEFDIEKGRFSFRLTAPYSEERRRVASEAAKVAASNLTRSMV